MYKSVSNMKFIGLNVLKSLALALWSFILSMVTFQVLFLILFILPEILMLSPKKDHEPNFYNYTRVY